MASKVENLRRATERTGFWQAMAPGLICALATTGAGTVPAGMRNRS